MDGSPEIVCWDRAQGRPVAEKVLDEGVIRWLYGTRSGRMVTDLLCSRKPFSKLYAWWMCAGSKSRKRIAPFVQAFAIDLDEFEAREYTSFNDFFARRLRPGGPAVRPGARGGPVVLLRLRPQDCHRFHYVDAGPIVELGSIAGRLHTVNPLALSARGDILCRNERRVAIQETRHFGRLAYVEIGAMTVGRIVQHHAADHVAQRGDEKGHFLCGGSTVALFGEPGRWRPDADLIARTREQTETVVRLGTRIASSAAPG